MKNISSNFLILGVVLITTISLAISGCTGQPTTPGDTHATPTATPGSPTATPGAGDDNVPSGVTTENGVTTMSGSGDASFPFHSEEGGYKLVFRSKGNALTDVKPVASSGIGLSMYSSFGASAADSSWNEMSRIEHWYSDDDETWEIKATGPFEVKIIRLPESITPDSVPVTYSDSGWQVVGPFNLDAGSATFKFDFAGSACAVELMDGTNGRSETFLFTNAGGEKEYNVPSAGVYYVQVNTNRDNSWTMTIEQ